MTGVAINLDYESKRPRICPDFRTDSDRNRMALWLSSHPELLELIEHALAIGREEEAA